MHTACTRDQLSRVCGCQVAFYVRYAKLEPSIILTLNTHLSSDRALEVGAHPDRIIYANPCKREDHLLHAKRQNVNITTFDRFSICIQKIRK